MQMLIPKEFENRMKDIIPNYDKFINEMENDNVKGIKVNTNKIEVEEFLKIFPYKLEKIPYANDGF